MLALTDVPAELRTRPWAMWQYGILRSNWVRPKVPRVANAGRASSPDGVEFGPTLEARANDNEAVEATDSTLGAVGYNFAAGGELTGANSGNPDTAIGTGHAQLLTNLAPSVEVSPPDTDCAFDTDRVDAALLRRARAAENGAKVSAYLEGDLCGKRSYSEALLGLAQLLAFWTGPDPDRLDRLVCSSELYRASERARPKWFTNRGTATWGRRHISLKAIATCAAYHPSVATTQAKETDTENLPMCKNSMPFGMIGSLYQRVRSEPVPKFIEEAVVSRKKAGLPKRQLAALCLRLAELRGGAFYLSGVTAGEVLSVTQPTVSKWLSEFAKLNFIRLTARGNSFSGLANCYFWIGPWSEQYTQRDTTNMVQQHGTHA
jgi:hypothetical protein